MQVNASTAYASLFASLRQYGVGQAVGPVAETEEESVPGAASAAMTGSRSALVSQLTSAAVQHGRKATQGADDPIGGRGAVQSWARDLNDNDRKMLESMTGYTIAEDGSFIDEDGNSTAIDPSFAAVIAAISLARTNQAQGDGAISLDDTITPEQYADICGRVQVAMFQAGDLFDKGVRDQGVAYLTGVREDAAAAAASSSSAADQTEEVPYLTIAKRNLAEEMVNDPVYGMKTAETFATRPITSFVKMPVPEGGGEGYVDPKVVQASFDRWKACYQTVNAVHAKAEQIYKQGVAEGRSGAEIYADILRDQLAQSDSYWQARDPDNVIGNMRESVQAELNALDKAIAAARAKAKA